MNKEMLKIYLIAFLTLSISILSFAQRQTGSIHGQVIDKERNALPGATVAITGPSLLGSMNYFTGDTGAFHFPSLLPGEYELRAEMPDFKTLVRKGIIVNVGKKIEVILELEVATVEEEITELAPTPPLDVQSAKTSVNYTSQFLASIPMSRDLYDIQNSIPGAVSEGVDYRRTSSILGGTVRSQLYALDGVPMNDPAAFCSLANINFDVYDEIEFEVSGHPAEVGQTDSAYINIVTKSGGNKYSGGGAFYYTGKGLAQDLWTPEQTKSINVNPPEKFTDSKDFSLNLGGPILEDKVWFFLSGRRFVWTKAYPETPEKRMAALGFTSSPHYDLEHQEWLGFAKLTFQIIKQIRYMGMFHYNHVYEPTYSNSVGADVAFENTAILDHENIFTTTHQFNWVLNQNTFADLRGTYIWRYFPIHSITQNQYSWYDLQANVWWGASPYNDEYTSKKMLGSASITRFQDDFLGANHEFKAGAEFEQSEYHRDWYRGNPYYSYWYNWAAGNPYYVSTSESIGSLRIWACPPEKGYWDVQDNVRRFSGYVQDTLTKGRLAFNLGLRLDHSLQYEPAQTRPKLLYASGPELLAPELDANALLVALSNQLHAKGKISPFDELTTPYKKVVQFTTFSPRAGLVFDIFGNGRTAFKLSSARYYEPIWSAKYNRGQIFQASSFSWDWYDLNQNKLMDLPPTDEYVLTSYSEQDPNYSYYEYVDAEGKAHKLKSPYTDEFTAGIEHELAKDFKVGLEFISKQNKNIVEDIDINNGYDTSATDATGLIWLPFTFTDPGWDKIFGTGDDQTLTVYGLRADRPALTWKGTNPPEAKRKYWAVIFTFDKRMSNKWQLKGSVLYSSFKGNVGAGYDSTEGESGMFNNPNTLINAYGPLWFDRPLQIKIMGTCILPLDFVISAYFQHMSGSPWERTLSRVYFPNYKSYLGFGVQSPYSGLNAEPAGTQRNDPFTNLDLRLEKTFSLGQSGRLNIYVDIFNVGGRRGTSVNQNPAAYLYYDSYADKTPAAYVLGSTYNQITSCYGVRSIRIGVKYSFN